MEALIDVILPVFLVIGMGYAAARARLSLLRLPHELRALPASRPRPAARADDTA